MSRRLRLPPLNSTIKQRRLEARIRPEDKRLLDRAGELSGRSLTDFVMVAARTAALDTIERYEGITLADTRDREAFMTAMLRPPTASARLRAAAARYRGVTKKRP